MYKSAVKTQPTSSKYPTFYGMYNGLHHGMWMGRGNWKKCTMDHFMEYQWDAEWNVQRNTPWDVNGILQRMKRYGTHNGIWMGYSKKCTNIENTIECEWDTQRNVEIWNSKWNFNGILEEMYKYWKHHGMLMDTRGGSRKKCDWFPKGWAAKARAG